MAKPTSAPSTVVAFRPNRPIREASTAVAIRPSNAETATCEPGIDLSGKPKAIFLIGRGGSAKTVIARWLIERGQDAGRVAILAALDSVNRTLKRYFNGVYAPGEEGCPPDGEGLLQALLDHAIKAQQSIVVDLGAGGETALASVFRTPDLLFELETAGLAPVALYTLAPRIDDKSPFQYLGFQPRATAFICNPATDGDFDQLLGQSVIRHGIAAGARVIRTPLLNRRIMARLEEDAALFGKASRGEAGDLGPWDQLEVRTWLRSMDQAFAGIDTWLA
jgi:hypothetical protein